MHPDKSFQRMHPVWAFTRCARGVRCGKTLRRLVLLGVVLSVDWVSAHAGEPTWVLVETGQHALTIFRGERVIKRYSHVALGSGGARFERLRGDARTPFGVFHVAWINRSSSFHTFFGLNYPTPAHAERAYTRELIPASKLQAIRMAHTERRSPPQDTVLGGRIGIHGLGTRDEELHRITNWTQGCIALTNDEIDELAQWVEIGTRVVIR